MLKLADAADRFSRSIGKGVSWLILPLIMIIMFDVITRKIDIIKSWSAEITIHYGYSVSFILQDLQWHIHGVLLMLSFGFAYLVNAHVRVDIFREMGSRRTQCWIELVGLILFAMPFLCFMLAKSIDMVALSYHQGEGSESMVGIPWRYVIKSAMPVGFFVMLIAAFAMTIRVAAYLWGSPDARVRAEQDIPFFTDVDVLPKVSLEDGPEILSVEGER